MMTCTAKELCAATGGTLVQDGEGFSCVSTDSRRVEQGCLFIPLVGERFDGHTYLTQALESGAAGCLCSRLPEALVPGKFYVQVEDTLRALGQLAGWYREKFPIPVVQITGSAGKTTTKEMIASVLSRHFLTLKTEANYNNEIGTPQTLLRLMPEHQAAVIETGMDHFGQIRYLGEMVRPTVAVITNIGLEHTAILGSTLAAIAAEKSGILKPGCRAVLYGQSREVGEVVARVCAEKEIPLTVTDASQLTLLSSGLDGQHFTYRGSAPLLLPLLGDYQLRNAMTVLDTVDALRAQGWNISADAVARGLAAARWPGRLELVRRRPDLIIDGGHNPQCAQALAASLRGLYGEKKLIFLIGVLADKDWQSMVGEVLPLAKAIITVRPESDRAKDENELAAWVRAQGVPAEAHASIGEALDAALALAGPEDAVCAWGSLYSVGELRHCLGLC